MAQPPIVVKRYEPIAPREELIRRRLSLAEYGCCGCPIRPNDDQGRPQEIGCDSFHNCPEDKANGPYLLGVRQVDPKSVGGGLRESLMSCHVYYKQKDQIEASGGMLKIVAREGQDIIEKGSEKKHPDLPNSPYEDVRRRTTVPKHPHIDGDPNLVDAVVESDMRAIEEERRAREREEALQANAGIEPAPVTTGGQEASEGGEHAEAGRPKRR